MHHTTHARRLLVLFSIVAVTPVLAASAADVVRVRVAGYKAMGAAFKSVNDGVRSGNVAPQQMQAAASRIAAASRDQYHWFPAGSGPQSGVKTSAKPDIWARPRDFRAAQDRFAQQAAEFQRVAGSGDAAVIRAAATKLGASCKNCHESFRQVDN